MIMEIMVVSEAYSGQNISVGNAIGCVLAMVLPCTLCLVPWQWLCLANLKTIPSVDFNLAKDILALLDFSLERRNILQRGPYNEMDRTSNKKLVFRNNLSTLKTIISSCKMFPISVAFETISVVMRTARIYTALHITGLHCT
jgi:hypothetical protein